MAVITLLVIAALPAVVQSARNDLNQFSAIEKCSRTGRLHEAAILF